MIFHGHKENKNIPTGKIIAKPTAGGGYSVYRYDGLGFFEGWKFLFSAKNEDEISKKILNLSRPRIELN